MDCQDVQIQLHDFRELGVRLAAAVHAPTP